MLRAATGSSTWTVGFAGGAVTVCGAPATVGGAAAFFSSSAERCSSRRISSSSVLFSSLDARLNSARLLPSERPSSGSLRGPKMIRAITKMMISSGMPMEPNIRLLLSSKTAGRRRTSIIARNLRPRSDQKSLPVRKLSATMPIMRRYRPLPAVVFAILVSALVGGFFGRSALATDDKVPEHFRAFSAALSAIEASYIDKVEPDNLVYGAVRGMLSTLDPHSSFFNPKEYAQ